MCEDGLHVDRCHNDSKYDLDHVKVFYYIQLGLFLTFVINQFLSNKIHWHGQDHIISHYEIQFIRSKSEIHQAKQNVQLDSSETRCFLSF